MSMDFAEVERLLNIIEKAHGHGTGAGAIKETALRRLAEIEAMVAKDLTEAKKVEVKKLADAKAKAAEAAAAPRLITD
jgi:hypothetical protein